MYCFQRILQDSLYLATISVRFSLLDLKDAFHSLRLYFYRVKKHCKAIMDNLLLFTPSKKAHMAKLEDPLKALLKNRLKISPKKCQLFKTEIRK